MPLRLREPAAPTNCCAGALFANTTLDRYWKPDLTVEQAVDVMKKAIAEVGLRLVVAQPKYIIKVVDKDGIRTVAEPSG